MQLTVTGTLIEWRGPAPHVFLALPEEACEDVAQVAAQVTYGWGVVPVSAVIGSTEFTTSLIPRDGGYLLPIKVAVRKAESVDVGDVVTATICIGT